MNARAELVQTDVIICGEFGGKNVMVMEHSNGALDLMADVDNGPCPNTPQPGILQPLNNGYFTLSVAMTNDPEAAQHIKVERLSLHLIPLVIGILGTGN